MIYFDNAATTFPKPPEVIKAVLRALSEVGANPGRGSYKTAREAGEIVFRTRLITAEFFGAEPENVIFTKNCTEALNIAIKGVILNFYRGERLHVITSDMEHNSVLRPLETLRRKGIIEYSVARFSYSPEETIENFRSSLKRNTALIVCTHASNSFGGVLPIKEIGEMAKKRGIKFIVDCAQTAGTIDATLQKLNADIICTAGHKGLYGPMGTGLMITKGERLETIFEGGTGSASSILTQPEFYPDRFESGTLALPSIAGLYEGIKYAKENMEEEYCRQMDIARIIYKKLKADDRIELYSPFPINHSNMPIISFNVKGKDCSYIGEMLGLDSVALRTGFHCAPLSHKAHSTASKGTVRISLSRHNTAFEAEEFLYKLNTLLEKTD